MKSHESDLSVGREVRNESDVPIKVARGPYRRFTRWLDRELETLVAQWEHTAAPNALRSPPFRFRRTAKPK
jgi:hypothetical protein